MPFDASEATIFATSQMIYDVVKWTCMSSVIRSELQKMITTLRSSGIPLAHNASEATSASSDEEGRTHTLAVRFLIPWREEVQKTLVSSASTEGKNNHKVWEIVK